jgi:tetratricopeptide (TPR) repeat protein
MLRPAGRDLSGTTTSTLHPRCRGGLRYRLGKLVLGVEPLPTSDQPEHLPSHGTYEERAIQDYDQAIRLNPKNAAAFRNRGILYTKTRQYDRAIGDFDEAIRLDPNFAVTFQNRGYALRFVGQYDRAIADYQRALTLKIGEPMKRQIELALKQLGAVP